MADFFNIGRSTPQQQPLDFGKPVQEGLDIYEKYKEKETARKEKRFKEYKDTMAIDPYISLSEVANKRTNESLKAFEEKYAPIWYDMNYEQRMEAEKEKQKIFYENEVVKNNDQVAKGLMGELQNPTSPYDKIKIKEALDKYKESGDGIVPEEALEYTPISSDYFYASNPPKGDYKKIVKIISGEGKNRKQITMSSKMDEKSGRTVALENAFSNPQLMKGHVDDFLALPIEEQNSYFSRAEEVGRNVPDMNQDGVIDMEDNGIALYIQDKDWQKAAGVKDIIEDKPLQTSTASKGLNITFSNNKNDQYSVSKNPVKLGETSFEAFIPLEGKKLRAQPGQTITDLSTGKDIEINDLVDFEIGGYDAKTDKVIVKSTQSYFDPNLTAIERESAAAGIGEGKLISKGKSYSMDRKLLDSILKNKYGIYADALAKKYKGKETESEEITWY